MKGTVHAYLQVVRTPQVVRSRKSTKYEEATSPYWMEHSADTEQVAMIQRGIRASERYSESRLARIEELRAQVKAGTYQVDSIALAGRILANEGSFVAASDAAQE